MKLWDEYWMISFKGWYDMQVIDEKQPIDLH